MELRNVEGTLSALPSAINRDIGGFGLQAVVQTPAPSPSISVSSSSLQPAGHFLLFPVPYLTPIGKHPFCLLLPNPTDTALV